MELDGVTLDLALNGIGPSPDQRSWKPHATGSLAQSRIVRPVMRV